jgi:hypothetical protein
VRNVHLILLVSIGKILIEQVLGLIELEEDALKLLQLLGVGSIGAHLSGLLADGKYAVKLHLEVLPKAISMIGDDKQAVLVDNGSHLCVSKIRADHSLLSRYISSFLTIIIFI